MLKEVNIYLKNQSLLKLQMVQKKGQNSSERSKTAIQTQGVTWSFFSDVKIQDLKVTWCLPLYIYGLNFIHEDGV